MFNLQSELSAVSEALQQVMDDLLPDPQKIQTNVIQFGSKPTDNVTPLALPPSGETKVIQAMRYSALGGGKRLRPYLTVSCANLFGVSREASLLTASAIEFIHTYSLIHDDLPALDNDDMRRGQPTCHIKFGEAAAILAGDALLTLAFQILSDPAVHPDAGVRCDLVKTLSVAAGSRGMVGGQMMDLEAEKQKLTVEEIIRLQRMKTGELFAVSCEVGAILGKAPRSMRNVLRAYAHDMGLAFQITDDLLDAEGTREVIGKSVNKDKIAGKATLVSAMGIERARDHAQVLARQAIGYLEVFDQRAENLRRLAEYVVARRK